MSLNSEEDWKFIVFALIKTPSALKLRRGLKAYIAKRYIARKAFS